MLKVVLVPLFCATVVLGEVPSPYNQRGFRPSTSFSNVQNPSASRIEITRPTSANVQLIPSRLTIEQLISLTENIDHNAKNTALPSTSYGVPERQIYNFGRVVNTPQQSLLNNNFASKPFSISYHPTTSSQIVPQTFYGAPKKQFQAVPQQIYGAPNRVQFNRPNLASQPNSQVTFNTPNRYLQHRPATVQIQASIQTTYDSSTAPVIHQNGAIPQTTYGAPNQFQANQGQGGLRQNNYNPPSKVYEGAGQSAPQNTYGIPETGVLESLDQQQNNHNNVFKGHYNNQVGLSLPVKGPSDFKGSPNNFGQQFGTNPYVNQQYLPTKQEAKFNNNNGPQTNNFPQNQFPQSFDNNSGFPRNNTVRPGSNVNIQAGNVNNNSPSSTSGQNGVTSDNNNDDNIDEPYLPPSTTAKPLYRTQTFSLRPSISASTTPLPDNNDDEEENSEQPEEEPGFPNVAVSTAVAGGGSHFYLQQPDGRLQRVVYQRTQNANDKPEEYTANYLFQNIQALPNTLYTPLITLGK